MKLHSLLAGAALSGLLAAGCGRHATSPTPASQPAARASISIASISVTAQTQTSGGHEYSLRVQLRETGGLAATISSIDLTLVNGSSQLASAHFDRPISDASNQVAANGTVDSRELVASDENASHPSATTVQVKVAFVDSLSNAGTATGAADVPAASPPPPLVVTVAGLVRDQGTGQPIMGGSVQIVDGPNTGKSSSTDGNGYYSIPGVIAGSFTLHAAASGYDPADQGLTVAADSRVDLMLHATVPCIYAIGPSAVATAPQAGGQLTASITRTSGGCSWNAVSDVGWIATVGAAGGGNSGTLSYTVARSTDEAPRVGTITVIWKGGIARLQVTQAGRCSYAVTPDSVAFSKGGLANGVSVQIATSPGCAWTLTVDNWVFVKLPGAGSDYGKALSGTDSATIAVAANAWTQQCIHRDVIRVRWNGGGKDIVASQPFAEPGLAPCNPP
jgi:hypothetical protein